MDQFLFTGVCTALVTPFLNDQINYPLLQRLLERQINAGIRAVVLCGTTGEAATLNDEEKINIIRLGKECGKNNCMIIAGTGSNSTDQAIKRSTDAQRAGADALLIVSPYYNKSTPNGLYAHYKAIAQSVSIPIIVYNVPSRTGVDIPVSVYHKLSEIPNIAGVKEASSDITKITKIKALCPASFAVWSGNDDHTVPVCALGGQGIISVLSNLYPFETRAMCEAALDGDYNTAASAQQVLQALIDALFSEVNPIPIKAAMKLIGYDCGPCRLPLSPPLPKTVSLLKNLLTAK